MCKSIIIGIGFYKIKIGVEYIMTLENMKNIIIRWTVLTVLILSCCVFSQFIVAKKDSALLYSVPAISIPSYTHDVLS
jgi:hypothetical protein